MSFISGRENVTFQVYTTTLGSESRPVPTALGATVYKGIAAFGEAFGSGVNVGEIPDLVITVDKSSVVSVDSIIQVTEKDGTQHGNFRVISTDRGTIPGISSQVMKISCVKHQFHIEYVE